MMKSQGVKVNVNEVMISSYSSQSLLGCKHGNIISTMSQCTKAQMSNSTDSYSSNL